MFAIPEEIQPLPYFLTENFSCFLVEENSQLLQSPENLLRTPPSCWQEGICCEGGPSHERLWTHIVHFQSTRLRHDSQAHDPFTPPVAAPALDIAR